MAFFFKHLFAMCADVCAVCCFQEEDKGKGKKGKKDKKDKKGKKDKKDKKGKGKKGKDDEV